MIKSKWITCDSSFKYQQHLLQNTKCFYKSKICAQLWLIKKTF